MTVSLFSLLQTPIQCPRITSPNPICIHPHAPAGGYKEWDSLSSELQEFLSALHSQQDTDPIFSELQADLLRGEMSKKAACAKLYSSLVIPVQELSNEYCRRVQVGAQLHLSLHQGALVLHGALDEQVSGQKHPSAADAMKGYLLVETDEPLSQGKLEDKLLDRVAGYMHQLRRVSGYTLLTSLHRTWFCKLTPEDELLTACVAHDAQESSPTFLQALVFFMHLVLQQPRAAPVCGKRKLTFSEVGGNRNQAWNLRRHMILLCRSLGFKFQEIEEVVTLQLPVFEILDSYGERVYGCYETACFVYMGMFRGEKVIFKTVDVCKNPEKMRRMVREVWLMLKLKKLQGDVIPFVYGAGYLDGGVWVTIMEDVGQSADDSPAWDWRVGLNIRSAFAWLHRENVIHGDAHLGNVIVGEGGKVIFIDFEKACVFESGDAHPDEFLYLALKDWKLVRELGDHR